MFAFEEIGIYATSLPVVCLEVEELAKAGWPIYGDRRSVICYNDYFMAVLHRSKLDKAGAKSREEAVM